MRNAVSHISKLLLIFLLSSFLLSGCSVGSDAPSDIGPINPAPIIISEIMNWKGGTGYTDISELNYIVCPDEELKEIAETLQKDIFVITGTNLQIIYTQQKSSDHAIILQIQDKNLLPEEYVLDIGLDILISGADTNAIFWGTRTLLQLILQDTSLPRGLIEDFPTYKVRGLGIDVARKPVSIDTLKEIIILMSWYKMNDLHLHLNDNAIMAYVSDSAINAYSAFRLESQIKNNDGVSITSEDYHYTLEEFAELLAFAKVYHVNIIPEFDTPAHSLAFIKVFPELTTSMDSSAEHFDLTNPAALDFAKNLWDEYATTLFADSDVLHIGLDESFTDSTLYYQYADALSRYLIQQGKTVRAWGSLSQLTSDIPLDTRNIQLNIWKTTWANPEDMINSGFHIINTQSHHLYIIPGGGYDYLDNEYLYDVFEPNVFDTEELYGQIVDTIVIDPTDDHLLGAAMFIWNDFACDAIDLDINEYDIYHRILFSIPYFAQKVWGTECKYSYAEFADNISLITNIPGASYLLPNSNPQKNVLTPPYSVSFDVNLESLEEITLFENKAPYGTHSVAIKQDEQGFYLSCSTEYRE
ncbi:MAG: family 20 glycosylhydrolase [Lachnospiraceae bacterium]|nr:family 20 glycosylhydrolase [Lachnospiraceae bacterium]